MSPPPSRSSAGANPEPPPLPRVRRPLGDGLEVRVASLDHLTQMKHAFLPLDWDAYAPEPLHSTPFAGVNAA